MKGYARRRTGATRVQAQSANISGSTFGNHVRIIQGNLNIFRNRRNSAVSPESNPSPAVQAQLEEKERLDCRRSLGFRDRDTRLQNISPVHPGTCEWVFETPLFWRWYDPIEHDNGLFWIKGNPGTGKSTLMKHILKYCQARADYAIAAYFFNARGAELEQTPLGMLRSLLFQLLEHEPRLYDQLLPIYRKKQQDYNSDDWEWREPELKSFLLSEIPKCQSTPLLLIIDALDECSEHDVQDIAKFLQDLTDNATDAGLTFSICLSSRHFPSISCAKYQELVLEKEKRHDEDIIKYISSNLTKKDEEIEEAIRKKSSGIFMWVVLVISLLNRAYEDGRIEAMKDVFEEIPTELGDVFAMLLDKNNPDKKETILILQFVLFSKRPLTPKEIYFAIIAGTNSEALGICDPLEITPDIIRRRIINSSRGLVEIRKGEKETTEGDETSEGEKETVQFIHESVNDFLVRNKRLQTLDPRLMSNPMAKSHDRLKDCCMAYLMMKPLGLQKVEGMESSFPFLEYASRYLFDHAEEGTAEGQTELLLTLKDDTMFKRVERFHNYFVDYGQDGAPLNLLQILAARGLPKLAVHLLDGGADINAQGVPCGTALEAAIEFENEETVKTLLGKGAKIEYHGKPYGCSPLYRAFKRSNRRILAMLIESGAKFSTRERAFGSVLHRGAKTGDKDIMAMVLDNGANVNATSLLGDALCRAAAVGHKEVVEMLLEKGAKIHNRGVVVGGSLAYAAFGGNMEIVKLLLEKGADVHTRGLLGSPLTCAAFDGNIEIVKLLLEKGANIHTRGLLGSPLTCAAFDGDLEVVQLLLEKGADIHTRGIFGSPLIVAISNGHVEVVKLLFEKGVDVNIRELSGSPLIWAILEGQVEVVKLLLEKGANTNAGGRFFGYPLYMAVTEGKREIVEMLLKNGANVNARGFIFSENLSFMSLFGRMEIPKILLEKGFKMKPWENFYGTTLHAAVATGQGEEMIQLLLDNGAKI